MRTSGLTLAAAREGWCVGIRWNHVSGWRILAKFSVTMLVSNDLLMFDNIFIAHMNTPGLIGPCGANWRRGCFVCIAVRCGSSWVINLLMHQMCRIWWIIWTLRPFSESTSLSDVAQVKSTVSPKKTSLNNVLSILQPAIIIIICKIVSVSFWILPCLSTPLKKKKKEFVAGDSMACDGICDRATVPGHCLPGWTPGTHVGSHSLVWSEAQKTSTDLFN